MFWQKFFLKMDKEKEGGGGGGGDAAAAAAKELADLKAERETLIKERDELKAKVVPPKDDKSKTGDDDLADKARKEREQKEAAAKTSGTLESALKFNLESKTWLKTNEKLLPPSVNGIFDQAEKENYGSAVEKANAIKVGLVQEFFALQSNYDLLTPGLKTKLEDFKKLVKTEKAERIQELYDSVFEPTFEMLRQIRKAEQVRRGTADATDSESAHIARMTKKSRQHFKMKENE